MKLFAGWWRECFGVEGYDVGLGRGCKVCYRQVPVLNQRIEWHSQSVNKHELSVFKSEFYDLERRVLGTLWKRPTYFVFTMSTYHDWRRISRSLFLLITITRFWRKLNSSPIDELGNWCLKGYWGGQLWKINYEKVARQPWKREPPLPAAANWHCHTERKLSGKYLPKWNTNLQTPAWHRKGGEGARIHQDSPAQSKKVIRNDQLE